MEKIFNTLLFITLLGVCDANSRVQICNGFTFDFKCELLSPGLKNHVADIVAIGVATSSNQELLSATTGTKNNCSTVLTECREVVHNTSDTSSPQILIDLLQTLRDACNGNSECPMTIPAYDVDTIPIDGLDECPSTETQYLKQITVVFKCEFPTTTQPPTTTPATATAQGTGAASAKTAEEPTTTVQVSTISTEVDLTTQGEKTLTENIDGPATADSANGTEEGHEDDEHEDHEHGKPAGQGFEVGTTPNNDADTVTFNSLLILAVVLLL